MSCKHMLKHSHVNHRVRFQDELPAMHRLGHASVALPAKLPPSSKQNDSDRVWDYPIAVSALVRALDQSGKVAGGEVARWHSSSVSLVTQSKACVFVTQSKVCGFVTRRRSVSS